MLKNIRTFYEVLREKFKVHKIKKNVETKLNIEKTQFIWNLINIKIMKSFEKNKKAFFR